MALNKSVSMCLLFAVLFRLHQAETPNKPVEENIPASPGQNVNLECRAPGSFPLAGVEWIRRDPMEENVFFCSLGEKPNLEAQHPSFNNRVELEDGNMTDGNVSVILKNVTRNDTGTYECHVIPETNREKRSNFETDPIKIIHLNVSQTGHRGGDSEDRRDKEGGDEDGGGTDGIIRRRDGLVAGVIFAGFVAAGFVVTAVVMKYKRHLKKNTHLADHAGERL